MTLTTGLYDMSALASCAAKLSPQINIEMLFHL